MAWLGYKVSPQKAHILKACSLMQTVFRCGYLGNDWSMKAPWINGLIHWIQWVNALMNTILSKLLRGGGNVEGGGWYKRKYIIWGVPWKDISCPWAFPVTSLCLLAAMR
jgi:hypothetical protein